MQTAERAWPVPCNSTPDHSRAIICYSCQRSCMPAWLQTAWHALQCRLRLAQGFSSRPCFEWVGIQ